MAREYKILPIYKRTKNLSPDMLLIRIENNAPSQEPPVVVTNFRKLFPDVSFPALLTPEDVEPYGFGLFAHTQPPQELNRYQKAVEAQPVRDANGIWNQTWEVVDISAEERAEMDTNQEFGVRAYRNSLLTASDWTQISDAPVNGAEWLAYRQALRDVPSQPGFPWEVSWPEIPA